MAKSRQKKKKEKKKKEKKSETGRRRRRRRRRFVAPRPGTTWHLFSLAPEDGRAGKKPRADLDQVASSLQLVKRSAKNCPRGPIG
jgi:hypothetical protein